MLIVEDEALIALDLELLLREFGYEVVGVAASGERAVEIAAAERPDLILMDIRLSGPMDGIEAAQRIRAGAETPILFVTGNTEPATTARIASLPRTSFVAKPVLADQLRSAVAAATA